MNHAFPLHRGPFGRRAMVAAGLTGLLVSSLSSASGSQQFPMSRRDAGAGPVMAARVSTRARLVGVRLLDQAVSAARRTAYQGVQVITWRMPGGGGWLGAGAATTTVDVWHRRGVGTLTRLVTARPSAWSVLAGPGGRPQDGMLGLTPALVGLLSTHYAVAYDGTGSAGGRPAWVVTAIRPDGSVAARFWLDELTALPLRRELFDTRARLVSDDGFDQVTFGPSVKAVGALESAVPAAPWPGQLGRARLTALRSAGWPVPRSLPDNLTLFDASQSAAAAGNVLDLAYSDGLSVLSVFEQRGQLPATLPGWRQTGVNGHRLYVKDPGEPDLTWSAGGYVFTVVAAAPAPVVAAAVNALPHQAAPGFWARMKHGLCRLLHWINPFR